MPRISASDVAKYELFSQIKSKLSINAAFRMRQCISVSIPAGTGTEFIWRVGIRSAPEQPRYMFLCFQISKSTDQNKNNGTFDHLNLTQASVSLNNDRYPLNVKESNFGNMAFNHLYMNFCNFKNIFHGVPAMVSPIGISPCDYKTMYPIYFFDVSHQSERLKSTVSDIQLHCRFSEPVPANTMAYVAMISDRNLRIKSDGEKMSVVY